MAGRKQGRWHRQFPVLNSQNADIKKLRFLNLDWFRGQDLMLKLWHSLHISGPLLLISHFAKLNKTANKGYKITL